MGTLGKYTTYVGGQGASDSHKLLSELFAVDKTAYPTVAAIQAALPNGDEASVQKVVQANAIANVDSTGVGGIVPANGTQMGDLGMFPSGVQFGFGGAPDVSTVKWTNPGDPANPYIPDITSPGPGKTDGIDKTTDPTPTVAEIKVLATTIDSAGQDLRNPSNDSPAIYSNTQVGVPQALGNSGGNV